ncbi:GntR family transcriptional regulator [Curtobacterium flaccumfaciens pv. flaccumfaciens]|uniref:GntR family transcriptional regulator n=1 Tax=Curtobacterium flaccumfaciens TaxID=2035 RepID=UPI001BCC9FC2|nr:GntR family transcriptional regulator [Curtobacterium flaccumfaciens]QVG67552.1 GntR family transcriptional regulator [Curtobacterium flaccumfaciens pv. flaccumfaciens]
MRPLFRDIAEDLADRVLRGEFDATGVLPAEHDLASDYAVARGTVRNALELLRDRQVLTARAGSRWRVRTTTLGHDAGALESFGQLARARGHEPVLHVVRVRSLDGVDVMLERTAYAPWVAAVIRTIPGGQTSVSATLEDRFGIRVGAAVTTVDALLADDADAALLGVRPGAALLQVRRSSTAEDGRPLEAGDDRYVAGTVPLRIRTASATAPIPRTGTGHDDAG